MIRVVHLFDHNKGSRYHLMINHGLIDHKNIKLWVNQDVISLGETIYFQSKNLQEALLDADLIFRAGDEHFTPSSDFYDRNDLWSKTVYYDFSDSGLINEQRLDQCKLYAKRVWNREKNEISKILPLDYCLMPEYVSSDSPKARFYDIVYMFSPKPRGIGESKRYRVYQVLAKASFDSSIIGLTTLSQKDNGRRTIFDSFASDNPFFRYMDILEKSKAVWTCAPDHAGGDSRLWEAFGSGALVVTDDSVKKYGFIDGYHCLMYNLDNIDEIIKQVKQLLVTNDWNQIAKIGQVGRNFALSHHRPIHRIQKVLDAIN